jgi:hypothetical protein
MRQSQLRIRTLMIAVAVTAVVLALIGAGLHWLDIHVHDIYFFHVRIASMISLAGFTVCQQRRQN